MRQLKSDRLRVSDSYFFGFVFLAVRVRNLNPGFLCPETEFFPLEEISQRSLSTD